MNDPILLAFTSTIFAVTSRTIQRSVMRNNADPYSLLIFDNLFAALCIAFFFGLPDVTAYSHGTLTLLFLCGILWGISAWAGLKALKCLDLNTSAIIGKLNFIIITFCGLFMFNESLSLQAMCGGVLIVVASICSCNFRSSVMKQGVMFKIISIIAGTVAVTNEKMLTAEVAVPDIAFMGFFFSGISFLLLNLKKSTLILGEIKSSNGLLVLVPIAKVAASLTLIMAFQKGSLSGIIAICQVDMLIVFIFGIIFLKEKSNLLKKGVASVLCFSGGMIANL